MRQTLELDYPAAYSNGDSFGAVAGSKFFHDVLNMPFHRLFGDEEERRYIAISISPGYLLQNIHFTLAQGFLTHMFRKMGRDFRRDVLPSCMHAADRLYKLSAGHSLEHVAYSACLERATDLYISFEGRKHDDAGICELGANGDHCIDAADIRQPEIHERNVWPMLTESLYGLASIGRFGHQQHVRLVLDDGCNSFPHEGMVVDAEDSNWCGVAHLSPRFLSPPASGSNFSRLSQVNQ